MSAHLVAEFVVKDPTKMAEYGVLVAPIVRDFGGSVLVRAPVHRVPVGSSRASVVAILAFPSTEVVERFLASDAYRAIVPVRDAAAECTFVTLAK